jgi:pSer/pThr/pTyr-binding forkhead associated (FHA) protein
MDENRPDAADERSDGFVPMRLRMQPGGHAIDLTRPDVLLGRHSEADLRMPLPDVSRRHCRFVYSAAGWQVIDLGSLNGVYVNGDRVRQVSILRPGDHLRICGVEFDVEPAAGEASDAPAQGAEALRSILAVLPVATEPPPLRRAS